MKDRRDGGIQSFRKRKVAIKFLYCCVFLCIEQEDTAHATRSPLNSTHQTSVSATVNKILMNTRIPAFISVVTILLGSYDLVRGFMHTILLHYSATHIAVLDLTGSTASDQLRLLGAFGISNYETGIMLILMGIFARGLAMIMLAAIPIFALVGTFAIRFNSVGYLPSQAQWGGLQPMIIYLTICALTFMAGAIVMYRQKDKPSCSGR